MQPIINPQHGQKETVLVIDQGTHATRAIVFDGQGNTVHQSHCDIKLTHPKTHDYEQDPVEILISVQTVMQQAIRDCGATIKASALVGQRATLVVSDKDTRTAQWPAISWMDTRSAALLEPFLKHAKQIHAITGLPVSPHYLAGKISWYLQQCANTASSDSTLYFSPLLSYITLSLIGGNPHVVDPTLASRTLLYDIGQQQWSESLLDLFEIPRYPLPRIKPSKCDYGIWQGTDIPLNLLCGDQQAMLYADGQPDKHTLYINVGSGAFVARTTGIKQVDCKHLMTSPLPSKTDSSAEYMLEGSINGAGRALQWLQSSLDVQEDTFYSFLNASEKSNVECQFMNAVGGIGSPWWQAHIESAFFPADASWQQKARAVLDSIVYLLFKNIELLIQKNPGLASIKNIRISGGVARLDSLCQMLANIAQITVQRMAAVEATARGAAWMISPTQTQWQPCSIDRVFLPNKDKCNNEIKKYKYSIEQFERYMKENGAR